MFFQLTILQKYDEKYKEINDLETIHLLSFTYLSGYLIFFWNYHFYMTESTLTEKIVLIDHLPNIETDTSTCRNEKPQN